MPEGQRQKLLLNREYVNGSRHFETVYRTSVKEQVAGERKDKSV